MVIIYRKGWMWQYWQLMFVCLIPVVSACSTVSWTDLGNTDPVVFYDVRRDVPWDEASTIPGSTRSATTSQRHTLPASVDTVATEQPAESQPSEQFGSTYQADLSDCSRATEQRILGGNRAGHVVNSMMGGALMGVLIGGAAGGLPGIAYGALAGAVTGSGVGYAASVNDSQAVRRHALLKCMALRGHRVTGVPE